MKELGDQIYGPEKNRIFSGENNFLELNFYV